MIKLYRGDCLKVMQKIPDGSIDLILADPPYGTTNCKWDSIIPLEPMWEQLKRVVKKNGAIVMTAGQPFTTTLISSNMKMFKYCWIWDRAQGVNFLNANKMPLKVHEDICVFYSKLPIYNKQMTKRTKPLSTINWIKDKRLSDVNVQSLKNKSEGRIYTHKVPTSIIRMSSVKDECNNPKKLWPTQKPIALMEYLIKTYTNTGETVLDFAMGSGTTGVACKNLNRSFIGVEKDRDCFKIAKKRILNKD